MLIKSVNVSFSILRTFVGRRSALTLKEISYQAGLPASKAHRYLQSLIREGMVSQEPRTRLYRLGTAAIDLGLEALETNDPVSDACETVRPLAEKLDVGIGVDVLGTDGPVCIWYGPPATHFTPPVRLGQTRPMLGSAAGLVFLGFLPRHVTRPLVAAGNGLADAAAPEPGTAAEQDPDTIAYRVGQEGYAVIRHPHTGQASLAAPVLDARGEACAAITFYARALGTATEERLVASLLGAANDASAFKNFSRRLRYSRVN